MWIKRIRLQNFGPHPHLDLSLSHGLVGIVGPNGCGKSTVVDAAYAAITGDFSRFAGLKEDNIYAAAEEGAPSSVTVVFEHNDAEIIVQRRLDNSSCRLEAPGTAPLTKVADIEAFMDGLLGVSRKVLDRFVFVRQWEMFSFLTDTPGERARIYQQLYGLDKADEIYQALTEHLKNDIEISVPDAGMVDQQRQRLEDAKAEIAEAAAEAARLRADVLSDSVEAQLRGVVDAFRRRRELDTQLNEVHKRAVAAAGEARAAEDLAATLQKEAADAAAAAEAAATRAAQAQAQLKQLAEAAAAAERRRQLKEELAELRRKEAEERPPAHPDIDRTAALREQLGEITAEAARARRTLETFAGGKVVRCPTCGTPVTSLHDHLQALQRDLPQLEQQALELRRRIEAAEKSAREQADYDRRQAQIAARLTHVREQLAAIPQPVIEGDAQELRRIVDEHRRAAAAAREASDRYAEAVRQHSGAVARKEALEERCREMRNELASISVTERDANTADERLAVHAEARLQLAAVEARAAAVQKEAASLEQQIARAEQIIARSRRLRRYAERVAVLRDEVFHRQKLPQYVSQVMLARLAAAINDNLAHFGDPFRVEAGEGLSLSVHLPGLPPLPAERLSGGQKSVLAIAFRTALSSLSGRDVGMLALDEPTAGMDDRNISCLAEALSVWALRLRGRRQVLLITHAAELRGAFDQVVELGKA